MTDEKLQRAVEVFRALGWQDLPWDALATAPLGSPEQRRIALAGLRSGAWSGWDVLERDESGRATRRGWVVHTDAPQDRLGIFAIRLGVSARRAAEVATADGPGEAATIAAIEARGEEFVADFVSRNLKRGRFGEDVLGRLGELLSYRNGLTSVPASLDIVAVCQLFGLAPYEKKPTLPTEVLAWRFEERLRRYGQDGRAMNYGPEQIPKAAVDAGWIDRATALAIALDALPVAPRPVDRSAWCTVILDDLTATDAELATHLDALIGVLATGEAAIVQTLGARLVGAVPEERLDDVLLVSLTTRTAKARRAVLQAALTRDRARPVEPAVIEQLGALADERDRGVAADAQRVLDAWSVSAAPPAPATAPDGSRWRATPAVWDAPRMPATASDAAGATRLAGVVTARPGGLWDVDSERLLATANALAWHDEAAARSALVGMPVRHDEGLRGLTAWANRSEHAEWYAGKDLLTMREMEIARRVGSTPVLLSTPSWVDLRVEADEVVERLRAHVDAGVAVGRADLLVAMARLDPGTVTDAHRSAVAALHVDAVSADGSVHDRSAQDVILARFDSRTAPVLGARDASVTFSTYDQFADTGLMLRQWARGAAPLGPRMTMAMVLHQITPHERAAEDVARAVDEAWERGLFRPGRADIELLGTPPARIAAVAGALRELSDLGMAAVAWPLLDDMLVAALEASRLPPGLAGAAVLLGDLAPDAHRAVAAGVADPDVLTVPGLRGLAARSGSSAAVRAAQEAVAAVDAGRL